MALAGPAVVAVLAADLGTVFAVGVVGAVVAGVAVLVVVFAAAELAVAVFAFESVAVMSVVFAVAASLAKVVFAFVAALDAAAVERAEMIAPAVVALPAAFDRVARGDSGPSVVVVVVVVSAGRLSWPEYRTETKTEIEKDFRRRRQKPISPGSSTSKEIQR